MYTVAQLEQTIVQVLKMKFSSKFKGCLCIMHFFLQVSSKKITSPNKTFIKDAEALLKEAIQQQMLITSVYQGMQDFWTVLHTTRYMTKSDRKNKTKSYIYNGTCPSFCLCWDFNGFNNHFIDHSVTLLDASLPDLTNY